MLGRSLFHPVARLNAMRLPKDANAVFVHALEVLMDRRYSGGAKDALEALRELLCKGGGKGAGGHRRMR